jgi:hypothetical protein
MWRGQADVTSSRRRAWFDAQKSGIADDPLTKMLVEGGEDHFYGWIGTAPSLPSFYSHRANVDCSTGKDVHFLASSIKGGKDISYVITHKDDADIEESWQFPVRIASLSSATAGRLMKRRETTGQDGGCAQDRRRMGSSLRGHPLQGSQRR